MGNDSYFELDFSSPDHRGRCVDPDYAEELGLDMDTNEDD